MTTTPTPARTSLSERVAEEIRAQMGRKRVTGAALAKQLGVSNAWISYRLSGKQPIDLNDLEAIADALEVAVVDLFPRDVISAAVTSRYKVAQTERPRDTRPPARPNGRPDRPVSTPHTSRRPRRIGSLNGEPLTSAAA